ncbi:MAG TPA: type II secretion system protein [Candidatus Paceibacterota bacterium]|nr:type II secretion system protein [Candidatus Paceibacterota bacterium]
MTYIELIVVLSIFSVMSAIIIFNYGLFQARIDIKNLASDIALKFVEAQRASLSGNLPPLAQQAQITSSWKPSYGVYLNPVSDNKSFIYFADLDQNSNLINPDCSGVAECLDKISITKGNTISSLNVFYQNSTSAPLNDLTVTFVRPNSAAVIKSTTPLNPNILYVQATILSPRSPTATIKVYPSGRIQVN